jgi:hypothetical protein
MLQQDCPNGRLTPAKFVDMYKMFFPSGNAEEFCDHVFRTFDMDKNGYIDFKVSPQWTAQIAVTICECCSRRVTKTSHDYVLREFHRTADRLQEVVLTRSPQIECVSCPKSRIRAWPQRDSPVIRYALVINPFVVNRNLLSRAVSFLVFNFKPFYSFCRFPEYDYSAWNNFG